MRDRGIDHSIVVFIGGYLAEGQEPEIHSLPHLLKGHQAHIIGLADFLQLPADAHVAGKAHTLVGEDLNAVIVGMFCPFNPSKF